MSTKSDSFNDEQIAKLKENHSQVYDKDVLWEIDNIANKSFTHDPKTSVNVDSSKNAKNSIIYVDPWPKNMLDAVNKLYHSLSQYRGRKEVNTRNRSRKDSDEYDNPENHSRSEDETNDESFDELILGNFIPFTGR